MSEKNPHYPLREAVREIVYAHPLPAVGGAFLLGWSLPFAAAWWLRQPRAFQRKFARLLIREGIISLVHYFVPASIGRGAHETSRFANEDDRMAKAKLDKELDQSLADTFPASDPLSLGR